MQVSVSNAAIASPRAANATSAGGDGEGAGGQDTAMMRENAKDSTVKEKDSTVKEKDSSVKEKDSSVKEKEPTLSSAAVSPRALSPGRADPQKEREKERGGLLEASSNDRATKGKSAEKKKST
jgi:hypothetical protein